MLKYNLIGFLYRNFLKKIFFRFDPEYIHNKLLITGKFLGSNKLTRLLTGAVFNYDNKILEQKVAGLKFRNPIGLSAGFDKNAEIVNIIPNVGFGFIEVGSVTLESYIGNPRPRLFRLPKSKGLVVYFGLMNIGVQKIANRIKRAVKGKSITGISVAKTNCERTSKEQAGIDDYYECLKYLERSRTGDYYTINISCPNTFGGEPYTTENKLERLLSKISKLKIKKPVFIKMPINLELKEFDKLLKVAVRQKITGVVIGNLTKIRDKNLIKDLIPPHVKGGISGKPTERLCNKLISYTYKNYRDKLIIIGVGGIFSAEDAYEKIRRGATLLQLITGMIFEGPQLIGQINKELASLFRRDGYGNISEAIGNYTREK